MPFNVNSRQEYISQLYLIQCKLASNIINQSLIKILDVVTSTSAVTTTQDTTQQVFTGKFIFMMNVYSILTI